MVKGILCSAVDLKMKTTTSTYVGIILAKGKEYVSFTRVNIICLEYGWYMVVVVLFSQKKGKKCCWLFWLRVYERIYYVKIFAYITSENFFCIYRLPTFYLLPKHIFVRYFFNHVNPIWIIQFKNKSLGIFYSFLCPGAHKKDKYIVVYL